MKHEKVCLTKAESVSNTLAEKITSNGQSTAFMRPLVPIAHTNAAKMLNVPWTSEIYHNFLLFTSQFCRGESWKRTDIREIIMKSAVLDTFNYSENYL